jgi:hypothetical protein
MAIFSKTFYFRKGVVMNVRMVLGIAMVFLLMNGSALWASEEMTPEGSLVEKAGKAAEEGQISGLTGAGETDVSAAQKAAAAAAGAEGADLSSLLTSELGVTETQAQGGAGAIFRQAQQNMPEDDFGTLRKSVPNMDTLLSAAPPVGSGEGGLLKKGLSMAGDSAGGLGSLTELAGVFGKLGLSPEMVGKFVPLIANYVQSSGGDGAMNLLMNALK